MASEVKKCAHEGCKCTVREAQKYCSQICEDSENITELVCECDHPACADAL
jgi:hypothetical protein